MLSLHSLALALFVSGADGVDAPPAAAPAPVAEAAPLDTPVDDKAPAAPATPAPPEPTAPPCAPCAEAAPAKVVPPVPTPAAEPPIEEDEVSKDQSVDAYSDLEDAQAGVPGALEARLRLTWGYVPAEGNTPSEEFELSYTPLALPSTEFLAAQYFEHDDVDNTSGFLLGWNQRWIKDGGRDSWVPSVGTLTEYFVRTPYISTLVDFAPGATSGDHIAETLTIAKYLGPGTLYLNGVVERRVFNSQICVDENDVAFQPADPRADQSPNPPQLDGCDYWADWTFAARVGYKLTVIDDVLDVLAGYWIETNEFTTQTKSLTYPEPEDHAPYNIAELAVIWHATDQLTISPGIQIGLDGREETPAYEAGVFLLYE